MPGRSFCSNTFADELSFQGTPSQQALSYKAAADPNTDIPLWVTESVARAPEILPGVESDAWLLLVLSCFLAPCDVSLATLSQGATPRKRWDRYGGVEVVSAGRVGLDLYLEEFFSDTTRLNRAADQLERLAAVAKVAKSEDQIRVMDPIRARVLAAVPSELCSFWRRQTLTLVYRATPWKILEPVYVPTPSGPWGLLAVFRPVAFGRTLVPRLQHALHTV